MPFKGIDDLLGDELLQARSKSSKCLDDSSQLAEAHNSLSGNVADSGLSRERKEVMFANSSEGDSGLDDHAVDADVTWVLESIAQDFGGIEWLVELLKVPHKAFGRMLGRRRLGVEAETDESSLNLVNGLSHLGGVFMLLARH